MAGLTFLTVEHAHSPVEDCNGHKKMRMDTIDRLQRKTPLKQRRSYFDSADYFLGVQSSTLQVADSPLPPVSAISSGSATPAPGTPLQHVLPMKLQPCQHASQPSRLRVSS